MALTPPPAVPQRGDRATFSDRVDAFLTWMANLVGQLNQFLAQLTSIAYGGAYAVPFTYSLLSANTGKVGSITFPGDGNLYFSDTDARGAATLASLTSVFGATSGLKAYVKVSAQNDPSRWVMYGVTSAYTHGSVSGSVTATVVSSAGTMTEGEAVIAQISRNGDVATVLPNGLAMIAKIDITGSSTNINFANLFSSNYSKYTVEIEGLITSGNVSFSYAVGGAQAGSNYIVATASGGSATAGNLVIPATSTIALQATIELRNTLNSTAKGFGIRGHSGLNSFIQEGLYTGTGIVSGFILNGATFTGGTVRVYGHRIV